MISTQRLIMIIIGLNLIIGMATTIEKSPASYNEEQLSEDKTYYEQFGVDFKSDYEEDDTQKLDYDQEVSMGSLWTWSKMIGKIMWNGINFASVNTSDVTTDIEKIVVNMLIFFRAFMMILMIVELIMFFKNKKQS